MCAVGHYNVNLSLDVLVLANVNVESVKKMLKVKLPLSRAAI